MAMKVEDFGTDWDDFKTGGYLLHKLPEKKLVSMLEFLSMRYFSGMEGKKDRYELFLAEYNARSSYKMAKAAVILAGVASVLAIVQIVLAIHN